jgi:hypothetical protein
MLFFLSYADEDGDIAREIADRLRNEHVSVYASQDGTAPPGVTAADSERAIQQADAFLALLSPASLTSASCRRERELALRRGWAGAAGRTGMDFVRVLQIRDTPYHRAGPLRRQPWLDLTGRAAWKRVISDLIAIASGEDQEPSANESPGGGNGGPPPAPEPRFENRERERDAVKDDLIDQDGRHFWLLVASPQHGKSWLLRQIADEVPRNRGGFWKVKWVDVWDLPPEMAGDADSIVRMMLGEPASTASMNLNAVVNSIVDKGPFLLCLLDSAELLDDRTVYRLRQRLDEISKEIDNRRASARIAVIVASRRDRGWIGLDPARPPRILRLSEFSVGVVQKALEKRASDTGRRMTPDLYEHAKRVHRRSEGLPKLLTRCLDWTASHWGELHLLDDQDTFHEIAKPYVEQIMLSPSSLRGSSSTPTAGQREAMRHAFQVLSPFRLFTGSHLSDLANRGDLRDALTLVGWSADDLWNAVAAADLLYRSEKGAWMTIDRPIGRLLFRYWYPSEAERGHANREAREFLESFALELAGSVAADMLIECLWHEAQARILLEDPAGLEASLIGLAGHLSARLKPDRGFNIGFLRDYTVECMNKDLEFWEAIGDIPGLAPGLADRVAEAVLHPAREYP